MVPSMIFPNGDLIEAKRLVSEARGRLTRQGELILKLRAKGKETNEAETVFRTLRRDLETAEVRRRRLKAVDSGRAPD
jgi:hypothetical protein